MLSQKSLTEKERQDGMYVLEQCMGFVWQAALRTAALLRVADHLKDEDKTAEQLAHELNVDAGYLYRVMRTLASREVFSMTDDGLFTLTPAAQFLRSDTPYSLREAVLMLTDKTLWQPAGEMTDIVKGRPVFNELFGMPFW